jgi:hypothetical protein
LAVVVLAEELQNQHQEAQMAQIVYFHQLLLMLAVAAEELIKLTGQITEDQVVETVVRVEVEEYMQRPGKLAEQALVDKVLLAALVHGTALITNAQVAAVAHPL